MNLFQQALAERHGADYINKMSVAHAAIAGLGGLGSNIAVFLCRMGIGNLHLIDFDKVDLSNLNRQYYMPEDIGKYKTDALKNILCRINPAINVKTSRKCVTEDNITEIFAEDKLVCEAFDVPDTKAMLVNYVLTESKDKVIISASGMAGFGDCNLIKTRKITDRFFVCGDSISDCNDFALSAARVAVCAAHQANVAARIILGMEI